MWSSYLKVYCLGRIKYECLKMIGTTMVKWIRNNGQQSKYRNGMANEHP